MGKEKEIMLKCLKDAEEIMDTFCEENETHITNVSLVRTHIAIALFKERVKT